MRKAIVGLAALGAVLLVAATRMKAHVRRMAAHCREMIASRNGNTEVASERQVEEMKQRAAAPTA